MTILFALPGNEPFTTMLAKELAYPVGETTVRRFPDGESYVRVKTPVADQDVLLVCTLDRPDDKLLSLIYLADAVCAQGARRVGLVAPYLAYMRQDAQFHPGEAVTSRSFATLLSAYFDDLVTVDPHLHRLHALSEIYSIPASFVHAAPLVARWIKEQVQNPLLIGPDAESEQWVSEIAALAAAPWVVLQKTRRGDHDVDISMPNLERCLKRWKTRQPVLVDDIISTAKTMIATIGHLKRAGFAAPVCVGVHAVFAEGAHTALVAAGAKEIVTCNTIPHRSNRIDLTPLLVPAIRARPAM